MNKKIRNLLVTISGLALSVGAAVGLGIKSTEVKEAEATSPVNGTTIYVNTGGLGWWNDCSTNVSIFGGDGEHPQKWVVLSTVSTNLYSFTFQSGYSKFLIARSTTKINAESTTWGDAGTVYNESVQITFDSSFNYVNLESGEEDGKQSVSTASRNYFKNGDKIYVNAQGTDTVQWWFGKDGNDETYCYLDVMLNGVHSARQMTRVGTSNMASYTFTSNEFADKFIVVRGKDGFDDGPDWGKKVNQTVDISLGSFNEGCNAIKIGAIAYPETSDYGKATCDGFEKFSKEYVSNAWSYYFLNSTRTYCSSVLSDADQLIIKGNYSTMTGLSGATGSAALFYGADVLSAYSGWGSKESEAISRYVDIIEGTDHPGSYTDEDFLDLDSNYPVHARATLVAPVVDNSTNNVSTIIIIAASTVSLLAIGGYFFIRRKQD